MKKGNAPILLGTENIGKLLAQYAIPAIIAMAASSLYNITDSIFIGHGVGALALSGVSITFPIMNLAAAFGSLVGVGGAALLSLRLGQKDYESANNILGNVLVLNIIVGALFTVFALAFLEPMLRFFGASAEVLPYARDFMVIILLGNIITHIYWGLNSLLRSAGQPKKAMNATLVTIFINAALNPLFIFGLGWGIRGSALATVLSQIAVLVWQIKLFADKESFIRFQKGIYKLQSRIVKGIISIGLAPFLLNAAACVVVILINQRLSAYGGDLAVGAYGIINRVAFLFTMIILGLNQGMQPIAGYNYGASLYDRVGEVLKKTIIIATLIVTAGFIFIQLLPHTVASVFTTEEELVDLTTTGLRYVMLFFPLVGFQMTTSIFFQSIGMAHKAIVLSLMRQVIFMIPLIIILPKYLGINGIWLSMSLSDLMACAMAALFLGAQIRSLKKQTRLQKQKREIT